MGHVNDPESRDDLAGLHWTLVSFVPNVPFSKLLFGIV